MVVAQAHLELVPATAGRPAPAASDSAAALLRGLNREQRQAVSHGEGPALVIAGPGTGKTEVVTRRVAWLIATKRALPREILALTFTDNAAQEMQTRVDLLVPYGQADSAIQTFHAFGDRLVRERAFELGLGAELRLLTRAELIVFLREHLFELGLRRYVPLGDPTRFLGALIDLFGRAKDEDLSCAELAANAQRLREEQGGTEDELAVRLDLAAARDELAKAFGIYQQLMETNGFIDHSDQVALALRLLRSHPSVAALLKRRFRYVLVDELQDTNGSQLELVLALAGGRANIMAVGDPDQGIYGFRGARTGNVDRYRASFPAVTTIRLRRNYRSLTPIVRAAQRLLAVDRPLTLQRAEQVAHRRARGTAVAHVQYATPEEEADGVAAEIARRIAKGVPARDHCVLLRSNSEMGEYVRALRVRGIDVDDGARPRLLDVPVVRGLVAFLRVVADPTNSLEAFTLASSPPYGLESEVLTALLNAARRRNRSFIDALEDSVSTTHPEISADTHKRASLFLEHIERALEISATQPSGEVLYDYLRRSRLLVRLARTSDEAWIAEARSVARLCELVRSRASLLAQDRVCFLAPTLELDHVEDDVDSDATERDAVRVLTVHRAKGLEFSTVFICGLVDGRFPIRSRPAVLTLPSELVAGAMDDQRSLAEERRLFYVALTRARNEVVLTSHEAGPHGRGRRRPSMFIAETIDAPPAADVVERGVTSKDQVSLGQILLAPPASPRAHDTRGPLTLSFSQIDEYLTCPERYRLRYDIGIPTPAHHALSYGSAIHQAIAAFHAAQGRGTTLSDDELVGELRRAWQPDGFLSREHEDARFAAGSDALRLFRAQQIASGAGAPLAVEKPFVFRLGPDQIRGRIDKLEDGAEGVVITDYKSSDVRDKKRADAKARESLQLQVYALAHQAETGRLPRRVQLHFVESGVTGRSEPTAERLDKARDKLAAAADAIRGREFEPKPSPIACGYCPFRTICRASAA